MKNDDIMTLEERLELAARSQAVSPEAAAGLVKKLAGMETSLVLGRRSELELLDGIMGEFLNRLDDELLHYSGFCRGFQLAIDDHAAQRSLMNFDSRFQPLMGTRVNNGVVLLGLIMLDHARGRDRYKDVYHCTRMTLGQYLDALPSLFRPGNEAADQEFLNWRSLFLKSADPSVPLGDALADILRQYIAGWQVLSSVDHVLNCMWDLMIYLQDEETAKLDRSLREAMRRSIAELGVENVEVVEEEEREHYPDPYGHFLELAQSFPAEVPDPGAEGLAFGAVREQLFLSQGEYSPQRLEALSEDAPCREFQDLLDKFMNPELLGRAMSMVNMAVSNLLMLLVAPYLRMDGDGSR